jgi:cysteine-rich repeat protein
MRTWKLLSIMQRLFLPSLFWATLAGSASCSLLLDFGDPVAEAVDAGVAIDSGSAVDAEVSDTCGDGVLDALESCDDNNKTDLDGCSASCAVESGYACSEEPSSCTPLPLCPAQAISSPSPLDTCKSYFDMGYRASGRYLIDVDGDGPRVGFDVLCDMATAGGGWTILVNNAADAVEPAGCLPRLASDDAFVCGTPTCDEDFAVPAYGLSFTELAWVAHDGALVPGAHNLFRWATPQSIPNLAKWTLTPDESSLKLPGFEAQAIIEGQSTIAAAGLRRVANENVRAVTGGFVPTDVVTLFDQDADPASTGNMSFTDTATLGLDDFQDGGGCSDLWTPKASRGSASLIMVR